MPLLATNCFRHETFASRTNMKNVIADLFDSYGRWIAHWQFASVGFVVQLLFVFALPTALCTLAFHRGSRSVFIQIVACVGGILLGAGFPIYSLVISNTTMRIWIVTFAFILLIFLPGILPGLLTPKLGIQKRLRVIFYCILGSLFLAHLFLKGGSR
jgi:hypothetical protein